MTSAEKAIQENFGPQIAACQRLFDYAKGLTKTWPGRPIEGTADGLLLALLGRSLDTFMAALRLASMGYGAQASMLDRSLFEDMIDAHWISTEPEAAERCYEAHLQHARMLLADAVARYPDYYEDMEVPEFSPEERKELDDLYGKWGSRSWTRLNLHERVGAVEHHWKDEAGRRTLHFFHDFAHRQNNQTLHVSSAGLNALVEMTADGNLTFRVGPREDMLGRALFGSFWILDNMIGLILDHFGIEVDDATKKDLFSAKDFVQLSGEQMSETGRNDPCPCGSGLKFKRCHGA